MRQISDSEFLTLSHQPSPRRREVVLRHRVYPDIIGQIRTLEIPPNTISLSATASDGEAILFCDDVHIEGKSGIFGAIQSLFELSSAQKRLRKTVLAKLKEAVRARVL
jgi:hypothetical protein